MIPIGPAFPVVLTSGDRGHIFSEVSKVTRFGIGLAIVTFLILTWVLAVTVTGNLSQWLVEVLP